MKVVATYNLKGGVGKTTTAVNLAHLAAHQGGRTLLWDLDPQGGSSYLLGLETGVERRRSPTRAERRGPGRADPHHGSTQPRPAAGRFLLSQPRSRARRQETLDAALCPGRGVTERLLSVRRDRLPSEHLPGRGERVQRRRRALGTADPCTTLGAHLRSDHSVRAQHVPTPAGGARVLQHGRRAQAHAPRIVEQLSNRWPGILHITCPPRPTSSGWARSTRLSPSSRPGAAPRSLFNRCGRRWRRSSTRSGSPGDAAPAPSRRAVATRSRRRHPRRHRRRSHRRRSRSSPTTPAPTRACRRSWWRSRPWRSRTRAGERVRRHVPVDCRGSSPSRPAKALAHFSVAPNTTAYGRYSEKRFCCSANRARSFSDSSMNRLKPSDPPQRAVALRRAPGHPACADEQQQDPGDHERQADQAAAA